MPLIVEIDTVEFVVFSGKRVHLGLQIFVRFLQLYQLLLKATAVPTGRLQLSVEFVEAPLEVAVARLRLFQSP